MVLLRFHAPRDVTPAGGYDGVVLVFPFDVLAPAGDAVSGHHEVRVSISGHRCLGWGLDCYLPAPLSVAPALFAFAKAEAVERLLDDRLGDPEEVRLNTQTTPDDFPFDPARLEEPPGVPVEVDIELERLRRGADAGGG